jgi:hypothetical protein
MKLCVDCEHYIPGAHTCKKDSWINPVDGRSIYSDAMQIRFTENKCGQEAKWFAEKNTSELDDLSTIPFGR